MNAAGAVVIFVILWWCVFFAVLPIGVRSDLEEGAEPVAGAERGAPANPNLKRKALITTIATFVLWLIVCAVILSGVVDFRE